MATLTKAFFGVSAIGSCILFFLFVRKDGFLLFDGTRSFSLSMDPRANSGRKGFQVDTTGCQIPEIDPFDPSVRHLYTSPGNLQCSGSPQLVTGNRTHLILNTKLIKEKYGKGVECGFRRIWRKDDGKTDNKFAMDSKLKPFSKNIPVEDDFLYIECGKNKKILFKEYLPFITVKEQVEKQCNSQFEKWTDATKDIVKERFSVTIVGIDSISRLNMLRHMPLTYNYLRNVMGAIDLYGFTKVGDNTFPNVVPLLTGLFVEECWNETLRSKSLNYLNLIWKEFKNKGFRTLFGEDAPNIATFNYMKAGFFEQPTDYYLRPFTLATEGVHHGKEHCYNSRSEADMTLSWLSDFLDTFQDKPTFSYLFNSRLTHDYLNHAGYADKPYHKFLHNFHNSGFGNNSVLIFFSDHGIRFGKIRDTYVGKLEERMPFFFLVFPSWFSLKYPNLWKNLQVNEHRLATPFDIYQTLRDILNFTGEPRQFNASNRGISLFSEIPEDRTCEDAQILPHWCTCHMRKPVPVTDVKVSQAARHMITAINDLLLTESKKCAQLRIEKVTDARVSAMSDELLRFKDSHKEVIGRKVTYGNRVAAVLDYLLTVLAAPSGGLFEGTVRYFEDTAIYHVMGDISRINKYGNQSACISNSNLKKFCYCEESD